MNRRQFVSGLGAAGIAMIRPVRMHASAPTAPVAVARCKTYGDEFLAAAGKMFDQLGGLGRLVKGKTVTIKINLTGVETARQDYLPQGRTIWTHPRTVGAVIHLLDKAGARRIRVVEGPWIWPASLEEFMLKAGDAPGWGIEVDEKMSARFPYGANEQGEHGRLNGGWGELRLPDGTIIKQ